MKKIYILFFCFSSLLLGGSFEANKKISSEFKKVFDKICTNETRAKKLEDAIFVKTNEGICLTFLFKNKLDCQDFVQQVEKKYELASAAGKMLESFSNGKSNQWLIRMQLEDLESFDKETSVKLTIMYNLKEQIQFWSV